MEDGFITRHARMCEGERDHHTHGRFHPSPLSLPFAAGHVGGLQEGDREEGERRQSKNEQASKDQLKGGESSIIGFVAAGIPLEILPEEQERTRVGLLQPSRTQAPLREGGIAASTAGKTHTCDVEFLDPRAPATSIPFIRQDSDEEAPPQQPKRQKSETDYGDVATEDEDIDDTNLPKWLYKYLLYRFDLLDRTGRLCKAIQYKHVKFPETFDFLPPLPYTHTHTGDNIIDNEEFEYVLSEFGVGERTSRQAFTIFTQVRINNKSGEFGNVVGVGVRVYYNFFPRN